MPCAQIFGHRKRSAGVAGKHRLLVQREVIDLAGQPDAVPLREFAFEACPVDAGRQDRDVLVEVAAAAGRLGQRLRAARLGELSV